MHQIKAWAREYSRYLKNTYDGKILKGRKIIIRHINIYDRLRSERRRNIKIKKNFSISIRNFSFDKIKIYQILLRSLWNPRTHEKN